LAHIIATSWQAVKTAWGARGPREALRLRRLARGGAGEDNTYERKL